jgi:hypothetical protein
MVRWGALFLGMLAAAAMISAGAGARTTQTVDPRIDVSSNAGIAKFLISHGIDPKGFVIQRGAHNYAGPSCPGVRWHCTTAKHVVQIMATNNPTNANQYSCTASTGGTVNGPNECVIIQSSDGSDNNASCIEKIGDPTGTQHCAIYQVNSTGANNAVVQQQIAAGTVPANTQDATQNTEIGQSATSGSNNAQVNQDLKESQSASFGKTGTFTQTQNGHQTTAVSQHSDTGNNTAKVLQSLQLKEAASGGTAITQNQDTDPSGGPNTSAAVYQNSDQDSGPITSSGTNNAYIFQSNDLNASGSKTGSLTQAQGASGDGLFGHADQRSTGVSTTQANQSEHQSLGASQVSGTLTQTQVGPLDFDPNQASNTGDTFTVSQSSDQNAGPTAGQTDTEAASCDSSGVSPGCSLTEKVSNGNGSGTNSCSGSSCDIGLTANSDGVSQCSEDCSSPFGAPPSPPNFCSPFPSAPGCGPVINSVTFLGSNGCCPSATPTVTVTGSGFGASPPAGSSNDVTSCGTYTNNGSDYGDAFKVSDTHGPPVSDTWLAGSGTPPTGACVGLRVSSWSDTSIVFDFGGTGSAFDTFDDWYLANGDSFTLTVEGTSSTVTVSGLGVIG